MYKVEIGNVEVAQAFSHADAAAFQALQIVRVPGAIVLHKPERVRRSGGEIRAVSDEDFKVTTWGEWKASQQKSTFGASLLTNKPLYGDRRAAQMGHYGRQDVARRMLAPNEIGPTCIRQIEAMLRWN